MSTPSLLRLDAVLARVAIRRSELYRRILEDPPRFPRPITIPGTRIRAWRSDEVDAWINDVIATNSNPGANNG